MTGHSADDDTRTVFVTSTRRNAVPISRTDWVHHLVVQQGNEPGRRIEVGASPVRMGRRPNCEIVIHDDEVSGLHCQVHCEAGSEDLTVTDLHSTNGTFVDGHRVSGSVRLASLGVLQLGRQVLRHEFRARREAEIAAELDRDLDKASAYLRSLLPQPIRQGPVRAEWILLPSARLGGDALGYFQIDEERFASYLIDVSGHGISAAVHAVSVLNVLRQRALPGIDLADPVQVLTRLNEMFPMEDHGGLFFTMWYGVYGLRTRRLQFASAGHHPAYLVAADRQAVQPLQTRNPMIGALPGHVYTGGSVAVPTGSCLHVFSDGIFEIETIEGQSWRLADFVPLLSEPAQPGITEPERLLAAVRQRARPAPPDDDISVFTVTFLT
jgi:serine phosphatase RsbU (regulator of sigma subunit)